MNLDQYNFNVPAFVRDAAPDSFDVNVDGAVVVGGLRIDNPAAAWVAEATVRKQASEFDASVRHMVKRACDLFCLDDSMFTAVECKPTVAVSDGVNTAEFNVYDNDSLNKAASELLGRRDRLPYAFAHDCAVALMEEAAKQSLGFADENTVAIRKLAGDYNVDFEAGKKMLDSAIKYAETNGMTDHAEVLSKIAGLCNSECSPDTAPYFITAIDEFYRGLRDLRKSASAEFKRPENVFYLSSEEYMTKQASRKLDIKGTEVTAGKLGAATSNISKWASVCGYSIPSNATPEQIVDAVAKMPSAIREEFIELFA